MNKQLSDVLEYLYKQGKKDLAEVILRELRQQKEIVRETVVPRTVEPPNPRPDTVWYNQ